MIKSWAGDRIRFKLLVSRWLRGIDSEENTIPALLRARAAFHTHKRPGLQGVQRAAGKLLCFGFVLPELTVARCFAAGTGGGGRQRADG